MEDTDSDYNNLETKDIVGEDYVEYKIWGLEWNKENVKEKCNECMQFASNIIGDYIWQKDSFVLQAKKEENQMRTRSCRSN